jgi:hypothetical protein
MLDLIPLPELLNKILKSGKISRSQFQRLGVISSLLYQGVGRSQTARDRQVNLPFVDRWKKRWQAKEDEIEYHFSDQNREDRTLSRDIDFILSLVADAPRSGTPPKFSQATKDRIIAIALDKPSNHGIPIEKWSQEILAAYLIEQGIVDHICSSSVSNFLKSARGKPSS